MAAAVAEARLDLVISRFRNALTKARLLLGSFAKGIGTAGKGLGRALFSSAIAAAKVFGNVLKSLTVGFATLATAAAGMIGVAMKKAADLEQIEIGFEVMVGDFDQARALLAEIRQFGSQTPFEFPGLAEAGQTLLAFGLAADSVPDRLKMLGDISGGDQEKLKSLAVIFGQIASVGKLMGGDLLQLINVGFNPLNEIAAKTGESMKELKDRMSAGNLSFAEVEEAFFAATSAGGRFFGMTEKQSRSLKGLVSTLKDNINELFLAVGQPVNESVKPLLAEMITLAGNLRPKFEEAGRVLAEGIDFAHALLQTLSLEEMMQLAGLTLKLGFQEAVNVLWRALATVVTMLSSAETWGGLSGALVDAALTFRQIMFGALNEVFNATEHNFNRQYEGRKQRFIDFNTGKVTETDLDTGKQRVVGVFPQATHDTDLFALDKDRPERERETVSDFVTRLQKVFAESEGVFDTQGLRFALEDLTQAAQNQAEEARALRAAETERRRAGQSSGKQAGDVGGQIAGDAAGARGVQFVGAFARAVNLLRGRTVNEFLAEEAKKTNQLLERVDVNTADSKRALETLVRRGERTPTVEVEVEPVFSAG